MTSLSDALSAATSGMNAQSSRLQHLSENIANADTPGYRRKVVDFREVFELGRPAGTVDTGAVRLDQSELEEIYDPAHPMADANGNYLGSNVDLLVEIADAREAQRSYEANLKIFDQARRMSSSLMDLLRR